MAIIKCPFCDRDIEAPEYAIVDRKAELPKYDFTSTPTFFESGYNIAQEDMVKEGWVKELLK